MTQRHLNSITLTLRVFESQPTGAHPLETYSLSIGLGEKAEPDEITDELVATLDGGSHLLDQTYHATEWGASGAGLDILLQIPGTLSSAYLLWEKLSNKLEQRGKNKLANSYTNKTQAVSYIADALHISDVDVHVVAVSDDEKRLQVTANTPVGRYVLTARKDSALTHLKKT